MQSELSKDGSILAITANANGATILLVSAQEISNALTGKDISQAENDAKNTIAILPGNQIPTVTISISPSFITIMPLQAGQIRVISQAIQPTTTKTSPPPKKVQNK
jgi:hypothetical protein